LLLPAILVLYVVFASVHAVRTPTGATGYQDAPDEEAHITQVRVIASGRLPTRAMPGVDSTDTRPSYEWHQPPLYYFLAARILPFGVKAVRFLSILIGIACIITVFRCGRIVCSDRPEIAAFAAGIAALIPGHIAITSVVNNDGLLELFFSSFLMLLCSALVDGLTVRRSLWIGVLLAGALLTKVTALMLLPVTIGWLVVLWTNGQKKSELVRSAFVIVVSVMALSGWWYARNALLYHEWLPLTAFNEAFAGTTKATDVIAGRVGVPVSGWPGYAALVANWTFQSFFAVYSTARGAQWGVPSFLPKQLYLLSGLTGITSAAGLLKIFVRNRSEVGGLQLQCLGLMGVTVSLVTFSFILFTAKYFQAQGRYFYPALMPIVLFCSIGWRGLFPTRYVEPASWLLLTFLAVFCVAFIQVTG